MRTCLAALPLMFLLIVVPGATRAGLDVETAPAPAVAAELVVVEAEGCVYCGLFRRDVLPAYQASEEGKQMPVRFVDINDMNATHLEFQTDVDIVPTFVVVKSNHEIGRISGYVGPENFYHSIKYLLDTAP
jgi:thioredoxin-related protein